MSPTGRPRQSRGFSLVELLIALGLGIGLISAFLSVLQRCRADFDVHLSLASLQEAARQAMGVIGEDVEHAGFYGPSFSRDWQLVSPLPAAARACGPDFATDLGRPVAGVGGVVSAPDDASGCAPTASAGGVRPGTDRLTVRSASRQPVAPRAGRLQIQTTAMSSAPLLLFADGRAPLPIGDGREVRDLVIRTYYIANNSVDRPGWPALRVKTLTESRGTPQFRDEEIMPGVEDLQVELRVAYDDAGTRQVRDLPADSPLVLSGEVIGATVWLRVRADSSEAGYRDDRHWHYARQTFVPGAQEAVHRRFLFQRTFAIRNARPS